jgi:hypothetical protein
MWSGDDQGEFDCRTIPAFSKARNSAFAMRSLSGSRRRALEKTGRPVVSMECLTPCFGLGVPHPSPMMDGNEAMRFRTAGATWQSAAASRERAGGEAGSDRGQSESASKTCLEEGSTKSLFEAKKSIPKMGLETAARMKLHRNMRRPKVRVFFTVPQEGMDFPSAPMSGVPEDGAREVCGNTLTAAPVSTRNFCLLFVSWR